VPLAKRIINRQHTQAGLTIGEKVIWLKEEALLGDFQTKTFHKMPSN